MKIINFFQKKIKSFTVLHSISGEREKFLKEIYFQNILRLRIFSFFVIILSIPLLFFDINRISTNVSGNIGPSIVFYSRIAVLLLSISVFFFLSIKKINSHTEIRQFHRMFVRITYVLLILFMTFMAVGDELISGSIIVFFGTIFTLSIVSLLFNIFSFFLYFANLALLYITINLVDLEPGVVINQRINLIAFIFLSWVISRYLFYSKIREYISLKEREKLIRELKDAVKDVKLLSGLLPICSNCKMIRDDKGYWNQLESYIKEHSDAAFSHSICPGCHEKLYSKSDK